MNDRPFFLRTRRRIRPRPHRGDLLGGHAGSLIAPAAANVGEHGGELTIIEGSRKRRHAAAALEHGADQQRGIALHVDIALPLMKGVWNAGAAGLVSVFFFKQKTAYDV